jgi:DNA replication and repair protein RecF
MDGLFMGATSERRKFFDRLVHAFQPSHATHIRKYEKIMQERARLLRDAKQNSVLPDHDWLSVLERQMAALTVSIAAERSSLLGLMVEQADVFTGQGFPAFDLELIGDYERLAQDGLDMLACEEALFKALEAKRQDDAVYGGASVGAHRTDMCIHFREKKMRADQCSTGEQKIMLMGLILTHAHLLYERHMRPPIILFDEVTAHLDPERREVLFDQLGNTDAQIWLSGTENALFSGIKNAQFFHVRDARIQAA